MNRLSKTLFMVALAVVALITFIVGRRIFFYHTDRETYEQAFESQGLVRMCFVLVTVLMLMLIASLIHWADVKKQRRRVLNRRAPVINTQRAR